MEDKRNKNQKNFDNFMNSVRNMGFQLPLLYKFFYWVTPRPGENLTEKIAQSIEGGTSKPGYEYRGGGSYANRLSQHMHLDTVRTKGIHVLTMLAIMQKEELPPLEGDLDLVVYRHAHNEGFSREFYKASFELCTYDHQPMPDRINFFTDVLKYWRGQLDTLRIGRLLDGKSAHTPMHQEVDAFLKCLEKLHSLISKPRKKGKKSSVN